MERLSFHRRLPLWFHAALILALAGVVYEAARIERIVRLQHALAEPSAIHVDSGTPPLLVFAKARELERSGENAAAIRLYLSLRDIEDASLRERALHNLATLYLSEAAGLWNRRGVLEYPRVNTLVELAKENYREALRLNPGNWNARHNLEYAWRITPPPREKSKSDFRGSKSSVHATLPGSPGGGP
jgi:mxaK protein